MTISLPDKVAPIPGDPGTIRSKAARFAATAAAITEAVGGLRTAIANTKQHESKALDALAENATKVADRLASLQNRYDEASRALDSFAGDLEHAQREAQTLVDEHGDAEQAAARYDRQIDHYRDERARATDPVEAADLNRHLLALANRRDGQTGQAAAAQARFARIVEQLRQSGSAAAHKMRDAAGGDGFNDSLWDDFSGWVAEHADILKAIHDVLKNITLALSVLSFFFPVLAPFALVAGALTAGLGLVLAATGQMSWIEFGLDVLSVATLGVGAAASRTIGGVMTALKGTRVARMAAQGSANPLRAVTGSFNGVLKGRVTVKFGPIPIKNAPRWLEAYKAKGFTNAHFLRVAESAKAGAGGPLDDILLNIGKQEMAKLRLAGMVNLVAGQTDKFFSTYAPAAMNALPDTVTDLVPEGIRDVVSNGEALHDAATWRIGS
ncbi:putative T7SS-secreted protein [Microbacterium dextranolyticum]|uniref:Putative T7SS secretion signal domain-containing protein n=1 Tax=Microbacterium dextranolyticum TaxID=36806 RepID=A0A9W6HLR6_9MICO|nr:hypothetical protein [Microbacterium dextranolyticum]MBM7463863.1 putative nucleic acid-binding Zn-ribbon protein [Microbacterium dextranolyticum]GLJ94945.1 hypothetical protein GCM10017591_10070 [Microbacterium dextranolyticum]